MPPELVRVTALKTKQRDRSGAEENTKKCKKYDHRERAARLEPRYWEGRGKKNEEDRRKRGGTSTFKSLSDRQSVVKGGRNQRASG